MTTTDITAAPPRPASGDGQIATIISGHGFAQYWFQDLIRESLSSDPMADRIRRSIVAAAACLENQWFMWAQGVCMSSAQLSIRPDEAIRRVFPAKSRVPSLKHKWVRDETSSGAKKREALYHALSFVPLESGDPLADRLLALADRRDRLLHGITSRFKISTPAKETDVTPELTHEELSALSFDEIHKVVLDCTSYLYANDPLNFPSWMR